MYHEKKCFVPTCTNTSRNSPNKLFVHVNNKLKKPWCEKLNVNYNSKVHFYCCEDHLNLEEDLQNYHYWRLMKGRPSLKPTAKLRLEIRARNPDPFCTQDPELGSEITGSSIQNGSGLKTLLEIPCGSGTVTENFEPPKCEASELEKLLLQKVEPKKTGGKTTTTITPQCSNTVEKTVITQDKDGLLHEGYKCDHCFSSISGYRYTCVQCEDVDLCAACEASGAHDAHYVLRVPRPCPEEEIEELLTALRHILKKRPTAKEKTTSNSVSTAACASPDECSTDQSESDDETSETETENERSPKRRYLNTDPVFITSNVGLNLKDKGVTNVENETEFPKRRKLSPDRTSVSSTITNPKLLTTRIKEERKKRIAKETLGKGYGDDDQRAELEQNDPIDQGDEILRKRQPENKLTHSVSQLEGLNTQRLQETLDEEPLEFIVKEENTNEDEDPLATSVVAKNNIKTENVQIFKDKQIIKRLKVDEW